MVFLSGISGRSCVISYPETAVELDAASGTLPGAQNTNWAPPYYQGVATGYELLWAVSQDSLESSLISGFWFLLLL